MLNTTPESYPMDFAAADIARLTLLIQRILDAEVLAELDCAELVLHIEAVRRSGEAGDTDTARRHIEQVACCTEALVRSRALAPSDGLAVIETARRLLTANAEGLA